VVFCGAHGRVGSGYTLQVTVEGLSVDADPDRTAIREVINALFEFASDHNIIPLEYATPPLFTQRIVLIGGAGRPFAVNVWWSSSIRTASHASGSSVTSTLWIPSSRGHGAVRRRTAVILVLLDSLSVNAPIGAVEAQ
jgi:hypothetical protein